MGAVHVLSDTGDELPAGEEGQLWFEGGTRFEYHDDPEKTAQAIDARGWSTLGDIGYVDDEGYVYLTDRQANMIISGGVNIYPREVEDVLILHPDVVDVAVVGEPDPEMGESVLAVVQAVPGRDEPALAEELIRRSRDHLASYKCPRRVLFVDELPRLPTGKLKKSMIEVPVR
jgi:acyl-CoA synthetase (AMP-forming)/AMP-acid ligase II